MGDRERGIGSGKVLELGFKLETPVAQQHYMSVCWAQGNQYKPLPNLVIRNRLPSTKEKL